MNNQSLLNASREISKNNINNHVVAVAVNWNNEISEIIVNYYVDSLITDEEVELCELTTAELLAEFSDIKKAQSECIFVKNTANGLPEKKELVYFRE
jgi:hypothetical protein